MEENLMPLPLKEILENKHRISRDDIGFDNICYFLPNEEIAFLMTFKTNTNLDAFDYIQSTLFEIIAESNFIDEYIKNKSSLVSLGDDNLALAFKLDKDNNLPFDNMQHFSAFSKDVAFKFYSPSIKRKIKPINLSLKQLESTSLLAKEFLKTSEKENFYNTIFNFQRGDEAFHALLNTTNGFLIRRRFDVKDYMELKQARLSLEEIHTYIDKVYKFREDTFNERFDMFEQKHNYEL